MLKRSLSIIGLLVVYSYGESNITRESNQTTTLNSAVVKQKENNKIKENVEIVEKKKEIIPLDVTEGDIVPKKKEIIYLDTTGYKSTYNFTGDM